MEYTNVPYGCTVHGEEEIAAVTEVLRTSTQMGKNVRAMEEKIAKLFNKKYGIMVNSGSSALYLAVEILNLPKGSEVITPALTFATTVAPQIKNGLVPVLVDVIPGTYCIDADKVEEMITSKTSAMIVPNLIGNLPDWNKLGALAKKYKLKVIEDSADTLGGTINGESSGKHSDISITSFYGSHVINCAGNGGMLCVNTDEHYERAKLLRSWGRSSSLFVESEKIENRFNVKVDGIDYDAKFVFEALGYNLEPSEMGAAFGLVQLSKLDHNIEEREKNFDFMTNFFKQYEKWFILPKQFPNSRTGWLAYAMTIKDEAPFTRKEFQIFMEKRNIQTRTVFTGNVARQPLFKEVEYRMSLDGAPNADHVMRGGVLLACHHGLNDEQRAHVIASAKVFLDQF
ncbi:MAG: aminotransferase class V-fold PLP-dependent enzyme [Flavobacteriales bacterium]|nr:aminotransferase class V-fold PLP-dependent enzyme [Flavobacteriales bacterium]